MQDWETADHGSDASDVLVRGNDRRSRTWLPGGFASRFRWQSVLAAGAAAVVAVVAAVHVASGGTPPPSAPSPPAVALDPVTFDSVLTLESPDEPGTPLGSEIRTAAEDLAVRAECSGAGTLTVSLNARAWLRVPCATGRVSSAERLVTSHDIEVARRGLSAGPFVVAQAGDASPATHWRVTVREVGSLVSGGHVP